MLLSRKSKQIRGTTVLCVRRDNKVVTAAGQVTMGEHGMKQTARQAASPGGDGASGEASSGS
jgi:ATP-dependent protease HslVU (ClpYQ) peptidase subunit